MPDYTFKDGRPTPLGVRQKFRVDKQRDYAVCKINGDYLLLNYIHCIDFQAKIIKLVGEIDYAVERHAKLQEKKKQKHQQILDNKLKPKGQSFTV